MLPLYDSKTDTKIVLKLFSRNFISFGLLTLLILLPEYGISQQRVDTVQFQSVRDSISIDSTDSTNVSKKKKKSVVDAPVYYTAKDSMEIDIDQQQVTLYGEGNLKYQDLDLTADYVESDLENKEVYARGRSDTSNNYTGKPVFVQKNDKYETDSMRYNTTSGKGLIYNVRTEEGEGFLHSEITKRDSTGHINVKGGKYTTCDREHPDFYMRLTKAIVIPEDKIVTGPAFLIVQDVPLPMLGIPFGFFPNTKNRGAGIIIPSYTDNKSKGFGLTRGGWYQPLGDHLDAQVTGEIYSKGSWGVQAQSDYKLKYKFSGDMSFNYNFNTYGEDDPDNPDNFQYSLKWSHRQDAKANPTQSFSANVDYSSSGYDKKNSHSMQGIITNQKSSSISYTKNWPSSPFNLSISANANQNSDNSNVTLRLPTASFNMKTIYPFRKKEGTGKLKWYENIGLAYNSNYEGSLQTKDSLVFERTTWDKYDAQFSHSIPFTINLKTDKIKMLTVSPSLSFKGIMSNWYMEKHLQNTLLYTNTPIVTDTIRKITYAYAVNPGISVGLRPKIYGMFQNTRSNPNVIAIRHVIQPEASFSYVPDMSKLMPIYYDTIYYSENQVDKKLGYSYYRNPPGSARQSGSVSFALNNNVEMKLKPKNDTTGKAEPRKVPILRTLNFRTSYNPFAEEFKWNDISINASSSLFKDFINLQLSGSYSLYDIDTNGTKINEFYYNNGKGFARFTNFHFSTGIDLKSGKAKTKKEGQKDEMSANTYADPLNPDYEFVPGYMRGSYVDFDIPWSLNIDYTWSVSRSGLVSKQSVISSLTMNGDFSLTPNWKIGFNSGYDLMKKALTPTNVSIYRDLHCWEMTFSVVPFGPYQSYTFKIQAKSSILRDLKWDKKQDWYDNL